MLASLIRRKPPLVYDDRLKTLKWHTLQHRRDVSRVRLLCRVLDGSLGGTCLSSSVRLSKRTGQPELVGTRPYHPSRTLGDHIWR
ncbi:hypothetical protein HPB48_015171 [Haemaphysalis longicornis]|uniref:Uncharacterized protein n=1 Tax=Haemaphysalis longicornis TaxID=44386 RepID=A0A9J6FIJ1_HAELO|nr:hypothetical protein HPB48_015171 [Haemaphysalis longicornis]